MPTQKGFTIVYLIVGVMLLLVVAGGGFYFFQQTQPSLPWPLSTQNPVSQCEKNGYYQKEEFLQKYTVKKGDSLLSIATSQLGDSTRVNELIVLNDDKHLSFAEEGWELFLPPPQQTSGRIKKFGGKIYKIDDNYVYIQLHPGTELESIGIPKYHFDSIQDWSTFHLNDCVIVLQDEAPREGVSTIISISHK